MDDHHRPGGHLPGLPNLLDNALDGRPAQSLGRSDRTVTSSIASRSGTIFWGAMVYLQEEHKHSAILCNQKGTGTKQRDTHQITTGFTGSYVPSGVWKVLSDIVFMAANEGCPAILWFLVTFAHNVNNGIGLGQFFF